jgi:tetratricopeptide (TPR) repeat protein
MASRVNIRFVTILAVALVGVFVAMAATAWFVLRKSAEDQALLGDEAMAAGDYQTAQDRYGRAISKDRANVEYYEKYAGALTSWNPEHDAVYQEAFYKYLGALDQIATLRQTDVDAHHDYLRAHMSLAQFGADRVRWEYIAGEASRALAHYEYSEDLDEQTKRRWPSLRRYRALAYKELVVQGHTISPEQTEQTLADFAAALAADPQDSELAMALVHWHSVQAERARDGGRQERSAESLARAEEALRAGLAARPDDAELLLGEIQLEEQRQAAQIERLTSPRERFEQQRKIAERLAPRFDEVVRRLEAAPAEAFRQRLALRLLAVERYLKPDNRGSVTIGVLDRVLQENPGQLSLRLIRGIIANDLGRYEEAIEQFQKIVEAPRPPISVEGIVAEELRVHAAHRQATAAFQIARARLQERDREGAEAALARAANFREEVARRTPPDSPALKLLDAEIAYLRGDIPEANRLLTEYNREGEPTETSLRLRVEVLDALNQPGAARDEVRRLTQIAPRNANAFYRLGRVEQRLQNWDAALRAYDRAIDLAPWNEEYRESRRQLMVMIGREQTDDPVEREIAASISFERSGNRHAPDPDQARKVLEDALAAHGDDPRLIQALLRHHLMHGRREEAARVAIAAAERNPENETLAALAEQARLSLRDVNEQLAVIEAADADEPTKLMAKYQVLLAAGRTEEAEAAIDALAKLDPDNRYALDRRFARALTEQDHATAQQIAEHAARVNADGAGGLTFRGRLLLDRGRNEEAAQALSEALERGGSPTEVARLLAVAQLRLGQPAAAIASLRRALAARPNDVPTILFTLETLITQRQYEEALRLAKESQQFAGHDEAFVHLWLEMEGRVGDKEFARQRREMILRDHPDDQRNRAALARLYVDLRDPRAPELIAALRSQEDSLFAVDLEARWEFAQGRLDGARRVYREYLSQLAPESEQAADAWFALAGLLSSAGDQEGAIAALRDARAAMGSEAARADLALARFFAGMGRFADAAEAYRRALDAGADDSEGRLRIAMAESLTLAGRGQEALDALDGLPADVRVSAPAQVVRSDAIRLLGRQREADEMLDAAIARTPTFAGGFLKRGQLAMTRYREAGGGAGASSLLSDAMADLDRSVELDPSLWPAFQLRAEARLMAGEIDHAIRDVDRAVALNPALADLRLRLLDTLLQQERYREAARIADNVARTKATDLALLQAVGDRFVDAGRRQQAMDLYNTAWETSRAPQVAARIVELSLRQEPPDLRRAREILSDSALPVEESPAMLMLRAQLEAKSGRQPQMREDALKSLAMVLDKPSALGFWIDQSERLFDNTQAWLNFLKEAGLERAPGGWGLTLLGSRLVRSGQTVEQGVALLRRASAEASDQAAAASASRDLGSAYFGQGRYEDAVAAWRRSLDLGIEDASVANNVAFTLADALGRPEEALPYAEAAAGASPQDPSILDTLGVVQTRIGRFQEASATLQQALEYADGRPERMAPVLLHLAQLETERGDKGAAEEYLTRARDAIGPTPGDRYRDLISSIQSRIDRL